MPRGKRRTTPTGAPAQPAVAFEGQGYGNGVAQEQLQQAMPAVDARAAGAPSPVPQQAVAQPVAAPPVDPAELLRNAPLGLLSNGSRNAQQPVTAGLSTGAGGGPELLANMQMQSPLGRTLRALYARTGDPKFRDLAQRGRI